MYTGYLCQIVTTSSVPKPECSCVVEQLSLSPPLKWATNRESNDAYNTVCSPRVCVHTTVFLLHLPALVVARL